MQCFEHVVQDFGNVMQHSETMSNMLAAHKQQDIGVNAMSEQREFRASTSTCVPDITTNAF